GRIGRACWSAGSSACSSAISARSPTRSGASSAPASTPMTSIQHEPLVSPASESGDGEREAERRRYGLLLGTTLVSLAVQGTVEPGALQQVVVSALSGASLVLALRAAQLSRR